MAVYTIGHSDHSVADLISLLLSHDIALVVDVRSQPYSRWMHHFNRELLMRDLEVAGIDYLFMGDRLGGRPSDPSLYDPGSERPVYERQEKTPLYQAGIEELIARAQEQNVAVMCSEGDHRQCHRHLLITQTLLGRDIDVTHIQPDGSTVGGSLIPRQLTLFG